MCTAIVSWGAFPTLGRTLDLEYSYGESALLTPRQFPLSFLHAAPCSSHPAILGVGILRNDTPLYYDAFNEHGLWAAALNFPGNAVYSAPQEGRLNLASFELIPWLLSSCHSLREAELALSEITVTNDGFSEELPPSPLHWMVADLHGALTVEATAEGLRVYPNGIGVLTNSPPFPYQLWRLSEHRGLSAEAPPCRLLSDRELPIHTRGLGGMGLPGDFSSTSRLIRAAFVLRFTAHGGDVDAEVNRWFRMADTVSIPDGCVRTESGEAVRTVYASCAHPLTASLYTSTYERRSPVCHRMTEENIQGDRLGIWAL